MKAVTDQKKMIRKLHGIWIHNQNRLHLPRVRPEVSPEN